jgi:hypothetical protein
MILDNVTLANILIAFGQQLLLAARPATPEKTEPVQSKLPPKGRRH